MAPHSPRLAGQLGAGTERISSGLSAQRPIWCASGVATQPGLERLQLPQPKVSNHLACLRWCRFITTRREGRTIHNRIADERVQVMLDLADSLLTDNAAHVAACCRIEEPKR